MTFASSTDKLPDRLEVLQQASFITRRHLSHNSSSIDPFWLDQKFEHWKNSPNSSVIIIQANYSTRFEVKNFAVRTVSLIRSMKLPVIWALKVFALDDNSQGCPMDLLKHLTSQALQLNAAHHTEGSLALSCVQFQTANTVGEWVQLLMAALAGLPCVYFIIELDLLKTEVSREGDNDQESSSLPDALLKGLRMLNDRQCQTRIKMIFISYDGCKISPVNVQELDQIIVLARKPNVSPMSVKQSIRVKKGHFRAPRKDYRQPNPASLAV